jgi:uncharacterized protein (TIGR02246 family)
MLTTGPLVRRGKPFRIRALLLTTTALLVSVGLSMACRSHEGARSAVEPNTQDLHSAGAEWDRLFNSRDAAGLAALYAEDVISMPFNAPTIHGRQGLQADFEKFFSQYTGRHETIVEEILATADWGIERARYVLTYSPLLGGREVKETGRHVVCRKKRNGRWQIAWELWNTDTPSQ